MKKDELPFMYSKLASENNFTGREKETTLLLQNFNLGINTVLISPKQWGKASLIHQAVSASRNKKIIYCHINLFNIRTEQEFYKLYLNELLKIAAPKPADREVVAKKLFKKIIPQLNFSANNKDLTVEIDLKEINKAPEELFNLSEIISKLKKIKIVVCITQFQNCLFFDNPIGFFSILHSYWKLHKLTSYCISVNKNKNISDWFTNPSKPFYQFADVIILEKINTQSWIHFITKRFHDTGKEIETECAEFIAVSMENHPYFVQQFAQQAWLFTQKKCTMNEINLAMEIIRNHNTAFFQREIDLLTTMQLNLLKAVCNGVKQLSSTETISEYKLGTSANVIRMKEALENKEIIDTEGTSIDFVNPLFKNWLKEVYFNK